MYERWLTTRLVSFDFIPWQTINAELPFSDRAAQGHPAILNHPTVLGGLWENLEQSGDWRFCSLTEAEHWTGLPAPIPTLTPPRGDVRVGQQAKGPDLPLTQRTPSRPLLRHTWEV